MGEDFDLRAREAIDCADGLDAPVIDGRAQ
jgi:hypothetical protein